VKGLFDVFPAMQAVQELTRLPPTQVPQFKTLLWQVEDLPASQSTQAVKSVFEL
jgi:hypothetical protein